MGEKSNKGVGIGVRNLSLFFPMYLTYLNKYIFNLYSIHTNKNKQELFLLFLRLENSDVLAWLENGSAGRTRSRDCKSCTTAEAKQAL